MSRFEGAACWSVIFLALAAVLYDLWRRTFPPRR